MVIIVDEMTLLHDGTSLMSYRLGKDDIVLTETDVNGEESMDEDALYDLPY